MVSHRGADCDASPVLKLHIVLMCASLLAASGVCTGQQARTHAGAGAGVEGKRSFATHCATCHGLDGRGGEHAPAIVNTPAAAARTDEALAGVIRHGLPDKGMPSFHFLSGQQIEEIISYIRVLGGGSGGAANLKGDPAAGAKLFFGEAGCSGCHMMQGKGGFIATDLTDFGRTHSARDIRRIILQPNKVPVPRGQRVRVVTHSGRHFSGLVRNEDNFSIALLSEDGVFHLLMKSEVAQITREPRSMMPEDYGEKLSAQQLDDLASFLILGSARQEPRNESAGSSRSR